MSYKAVVKMLLSASAVSASAGSDLLFQETRSPLVGEEKVFTPPSDAQYRMLQTDEEISEAISTIMEYAAANLIDLTTLTDEEIKELATTAGVSEDI